MFVIARHIKAIHSETYSLLIEQYIRDPAEKDMVFNAIKKKRPAAKAKAFWAIQWLNSETSFAERVVAFDALTDVEGILFSAWPLQSWLQIHVLMPGEQSDPKNLHIVSTNARKSTAIGG